MKPFRFRNFLVAGAYLHFVSVDKQNAEFTYRL